MIIKVCGLKYQENIEELSLLNLDMMGFIFYAKSKRFVGNTLEKSILKDLPEHIKKIAVVVNETIENCIAIMQEYPFDYLQLHGDESATYCAQIKSEGIAVIKAFSVDEQFDFQLTTAYEPHCDYFLFDTKGKEKGGNGVAFDWSVLNNYMGKLPFILSGGLGPSNIERATQIPHKKMIGLDINSQLEESPALKSVPLTAEIINYVKKM